MAPREHKELEKFERAPTTQAVAPLDLEEKKDSYVRPVKTREQDELDEKTLIIPKAKVCIFLLL